LLEQARSSSPRAFRPALRLPSWVTPSHVVLFAILAVAFGFYARTIGYWFYFDDFWFLRASQSTPLGSYAVAAFNYRHEQYVPEFLFRPLFVLSFRGLYEMFGLHAWAYHLFGLTLHLASGVLLWQIAVKITRRPMVAHLATLIFLLHPTYAVAVVFVTNNVVVIGTFAYLSSLLLFLLFLEGGAKRGVYYAGSFFAFVAALLVHPETSFVFSILVLSYVLLRPTTLAELRSVRGWAPLVPFLLIEIGGLVTQAKVREATAFQSMSFKLGAHMAGNYVRYAALALDPYRAETFNWFAADGGPLSNWRTLLPVASGVGAAAVLLFIERRRPAAGTFALLWFILAVLPLSTWTAGAFSRKLYVAGPALALTVAIFAVSAWDVLPSRLQAGLRYLVPTHFIFVLLVISMGIRVVEMTDPYGDATGGYRTMVAEVRAKYPTIPEGSRLYLAGVPWPMLVYGSDSAGLTSAMRLYYRDTEIFAVADPGRLAQLPNPPTAEDTVFQYKCPPICQPPVR